MAIGASTRKICWVTLILLCGCLWLPTTYSFSSSRNGCVQLQQLTTDVGALKNADSSLDTIVMEEPTLLHTFWGQERTGDEIAVHIKEQLSDLDILPIVTILQAEPPLIIIDNLLSHDECISIIQAAKDHLQRSTLGAEQEESKTRTSTTAWIKDNQCSSPLRRMASAVSLISGLPPSHMENLQVCRYQVGQEFAIHTDHLDSFNELPVRGRLCTCLIYLQKCDEGGATRFYEYPHADVAPAPGRAVFFWNTQERPASVGYNSNMFLNVDSRMRHAGMPVDVGEKWICNRWVHPIDINSGVRGV